MVCHLGISFEQACEHCEQLGLSQVEQQTLSLLQEQDPQE
ncbi:hypothetical protein C3405_23470 [Aeromonas hydrophila]|nr:hypothetical protein C2U40_24375 [Aeromonas sp. ASNIH4]POU31540.1 hypothetical protein C3405_23470 [Aeromonas hydrophila]POV85501.1 hypothetical protein C3395_23555 [Aeromonas sp. ASNIH6]QGZ75352.1 hypothetical protein GQR50_21060 [Aeromonas hydrophila]